jgi:diguanylate cyclase (GGDEF)-like protein
VDELTGLGNRRMVNQVLQQEVNRARRGGTELSLVLIDVDFFKKYNDTYGHAAGDEVLRRLGELMRRAISRAGEVVARYGGEEFLLILPGADTQTARRTAEHLASMVYEENSPHASSDIGERVSLSQGVLTVAPQSEVATVELIDRVDAALYEAKHRGRNTIVVAS